MAHVRDLWTRPNPEDPKNKKARIRTARWGVGKRWQAVWEENGREAYKSFDNYDAAERHCSRAEVGRDDGTWITKDKRDIPLSDMWTIWIATKAGKSRSTVGGYTSAWRRISDQYGARPCASLTRAEIAAWLPTLTTTIGVAEGQPPRPLSGAMKRKVGIVINALLDTAVEEGVIHANPMKARDIPRQEKSERRYLSVAEVDRLLDAAPTDAARLLVTVLIYTGVRPGEAKGVKVKDLDAHHGRLRIRRDVDDLGNEDETKTRDHRDVPIGGDLLYDLEDAAEDKPADASLLPDEHGNVWTETRWRRAWAAMTKTAEIGDFTTYELRHTAASLAIHSGANVKTVQRMLGHTSAALTLDISGHLWDDGRDALPAAMDAHMKAERQRFRDRAARRAERDREARRGGCGGAGCRWCNAAGWVRIRTVSVRFRYGTSGDNQQQRATTSCPGKRENPGQPGG